MVENIWQQFESPDSNYHLQDLGRPAVFLIPLTKLQWKVDGVACGEHIQQFLTATFGACSFRSSPVPSSGIWIGPGQKIELDESLRYEVSFAGKDRIPLLLEELARIAILIEEKCIYFAAGQYACLIHPR